MGSENRVRRFLLNNTTIILFVLLFVIFGVVAPRFFTGKNLENILSNASYIGIIAVGMTFVLLTGGIDLSVGSTMYVSAVVTGYFINELHVAPMLGLPICLLVGIGMGAINAFTITKLGLVPFIATLTTMVAGRGLGLAITKSTAVNFPESITLMSTQDVLGFIPLQIVAFLLVVVLAAVFLRYTTAGRQLYAVGNDVEAARKAGIRTRSLTASTYVVCGLLAALGGFVSITQLGRVNANFGSGDEFDAIAAAVLGGASLFGGVGTVFPGTLLGTVLIQMIQAGLVFTNMDLYIQPLVMAAIIFFAVFLDSARNAELRRLNRRHIMKASETESVAPPARGTASG